MNRLYVDGKMTRFEIIEKNNDIYYRDTISGFRVTNLEIQRAIKFREERNDFYDMFLYQIMGYDNTIKDKLENDKWLFDRRKTILIDMDSVLTDLIKGVIEFINEVKGKNYTKEDFAKSYDLGEVLCCEDYDLLFNTPEIFDRLDVVEDAKLYLSMLYSWYDIKIVSAAWWQCIPYKVSWLHKNFPFIKDEDIIFTRDKSSIIGDYLIDDYSKNIQDMLIKNEDRKICYNSSEDQVKTECILFKAVVDDDKDFSMYDDEVKRMYSWKEIYDYLKIIDKK